MQDLTRLDTHFAFGENWRDFASSITAAHIGEAERALDRLLGAATLRGKTFLDIGCGSGLHSLAALRLGAARVLACDIDPASVSTTKAVLQAQSPSPGYEVVQRSIFDLDPAQVGQFECVYSWGVLHHTGDMIKALTKACELVSTGGVFAFALYRKTLLCPLWTLEKRWYARTTPQRQRMAANLYMGAHRLALRFTERDPTAYVEGYVGKRGMSYEHDVHDWLGGYPYESISPRAVDELMTSQSMHLVGRNVDRRFTQLLGLFGSGCDEFVYSKG
jgi:2-polyprenyl-6-hydroxyphenyl methylase/3-demethylubiquinone-9 3-methyltransferase